MRKEKLYTGCLLLMALITGSCSEEENPEVRSATKPAEPYTSYYYYSYEAARQLSATDFALAEGQFTPGPTYIKGDTLFVANIQSGALVWNFMTGTRTDIWLRSKAGNIKRQNRSFRIRLKRSEYPVTGCTLQT